MAAIEPSKALDLSDCALLYHSAHCVSIMQIECARWPQLATQSSHIELLALNGCCQCARRSTAPATECGRTGHEWTLRKWAIGKFDGVSARALCAPCLPSKELLEERSREEKAIWWRSTGPAAHIAAGRADAAPAPSFFVGSSPCDKAIVSPSRRQIDS